MKKPKGPDHPSGPLFFSPDHITQDLFLSSFINAGACIQVHRHYALASLQHLRPLCRLRHWPQHSARQPRRHRQSQWPPPQAVVLSQVFCLRDEYSGILCRLPRPGVLPRHIQRPQSRHYAPRRHSLITRNDIIYFIRYICNNFFSIKHIV